MVQCFQLAPMTHCATMATAETPEGRTVQEIILEVLNYLNDTRFHQHRTDVKVLLHSQGHIQCLKATTICLRDAITLGGQWLAAGCGE